eukprot:6174184-Pleurochrysis_carterae.AAC.2
MNITYALRKYDVAVVQLKHKTRHPDRKCDKKNQEDEKTPTPVTALTLPLLIQSATALTVYTRSIYQNAFLFVCSQSLTDTLFTRLIIKSVTRCKLPDIVLGDADLTPPQEMFRIHVTKPGTPKYRLAVEPLYVFAISESIMGPSILEINKITDSCYVPSDCGPSDLELPLKARRVGLVMMPNANYESGVQWRPEYCVPDRLQHALGRVPDVDTSAGASFMLSQAFLRV